MSESTRQIVDEIESKLKSARSRLLLAKLSFGVVIGLSVFVAIWLFLAGMEALFWMSPPVRIAAVGVAAVTLLVLGVLFVLDPAARLMGWFKAPLEDSVAHMVETRVPDTRNRLLNTLHLSSGRHSESPGELVDGAIQELAVPIRSASFDAVESFERVRRALRLAAIPLLGLLTFILSAPGPFMGATSRLASPARSFDRPAPFALEVSPGDVEVISGDSLRFEIILRGSAHVQPEIELRRTGERSISRVRAERDAARSFVHAETNIRQDFRYRAVAGPVESPWYSVVVVDRPVVRELSVSVESPAYSRIGRVDLATNAGDVVALPGSRVLIALELGGSPSATAEIVFDTGKRTPLEVAGSTASGEFRLTRAGTYHFELRSEKGVAGRNPIQYRLELLTDASPSVVIVSPEAVSELSDPFEPAIAARAVDDYGIRRVSLMYRLAQSRFGSVSETFAELPIESFERYQLDQLVERVWSMRTESGLSPVPGDVIEYFVRVWDNDAFTGFKPADSRLHQFVLPSLADQYRDLEEESGQTETHLEELLEKTREVGGRFDELRDELRRKPEAGWDDARQLEQIEQLQREVEKGLKDVSAEVEDLARQMEDNGLLSEETLNTYEELQRAIEEINSPELMEALQKLREAMQSMDLQQMQQAIQDFEFNEEQFKDRLERALDLFKRLKARQSLEEAARRAEELARLQEEIRKETEELAGHKDSDRSGSQEQNQQEDEGRSADDAQDESDRAEQRAKDLAHQQERAEAEMRDLEERLEEVQEMLEEIPRMPTEPLEEIRSRLEEQDLPGQLRENAEQLRQQQTQPAMQGQEQMQQQLQKLQQQLTEMQQSMQGRQLQLNIAGLRQALNDVLILSQQQEEAMSGVGETAADSPALRRYAKRQIELGEGLQVVSDTLRQLSREVPEMSREVQAQTGSALREMGQATESLAERSARRASAHQKASMMHLNEMALLLSDLLNMLMNQQMSTGMPSMQQMLEQLQQMAGQQQQLNQQIQEMLNNLQGQRLTQDVQERMRQLARQQEQIKQQLKELGRNPELRGNALGDLNKIAEEMEETVRELEQFRQDRELLQRQQQILTRLLDASRSMNTRGREKRRESRTGEDPERQSPGELTPDQKADELRRDLIRALESGYAPDYEELIKRYFELLQESTQESAPD